MRHGALRVLILSLLMGATSQAAPPSVYRLHLFREPDSLAPLEQRNSNAGYVLSQILSPLIRWQDGAFQPGLASSCETPTARKVVCKLRHPLHFSDGSALTEKDWTSFFEKVLDPQNKSPLARELFDVRGAEERFQGQSKPPPLGIELKENRLTFHLKRPQREFLYRLTNPLLSPSKGDPLRRGGPVNFIGTGPYRISAWATGSKIRLEKNSFSTEGHPQRPDLEILFIGEDSVALKLYETNELQFLRRLPTAFIPRYQKRPDYHEIPQIRFDYFGFAKRFRGPPEHQALQEALIFGFPYEGLQKLFSAKPRPGCFGIPKEWTGGALCYEFQPEKAREKIKKASPKSLAVVFSQSVEDHRRALEWLQLEWRKNLEFQLVLDGSETKIFLDRLEKREASFFRRGLAPDRPTCAAVLENFLPGAPENFLDLDDPLLNRNVKKLLETASDVEKIRLCRESVEHLRGLFVMIPTGPMFFAVLSSPHFTGWNLNELNQLDLKDLHPVTTEVTPH